MSSQNVKVYPITLRRRKNEKCTMLSFHKDVEYKQWKSVQICRENNERLYKEKEEEPSYGAGSAYLKKEREEKKLANMRSRKIEYKEENQPFLMKVRSDNTERHFKSTRTAGALEKIDYYLFSQNQDGSIEAFPVQDWHNFSAHNRFKHMESEDAEKEYEKRNQTFNYFALKIKNSLKVNTEEDEEKNVRPKKDLKVTEMDEWIISDDESSEEDNTEQDNLDEKPKNKKRGKCNDKNKAKKKKRKWERDGEAVEDSDDGDDEGREKEYISDSSDSEIEDHKLTSVAEEKGLKNLLSSESESESSDEEFGDEKNKKEEEDEKEEEEENEKEEEKENEKKENKKKQKKKKHGDIFDMFSDDSNDEEEGKDKKVECTEKEGTEPKKQGNSKGKKKIELKVVKEEVQLSAKEKVLQMCLAKIHNKESSSTSMVSTMPGNSGTQSDQRRIITMDDVRKYFNRKPITMPDLLRKFRSRGIPTEDLIKQVGEIINKLKPKITIINEKNYYSLE